MNLGFVAVDATLDKEVGFFRADHDARMTAKRTDLDGVPSPGTGRWRLMRLSNPMQRHFPPTFQCSAIAIQTAFEPQETCSGNLGTTVTPGRRTCGRNGRTVQKSPQVN